MNLTPEQELEIFQLSKIFASIVWWLVITLALFGILYSIAKSLKQNQYYRSLTNKEKIIIDKYNNVKVFKKNENIKHTESKQN